MPELPEPVQPADEDLGDVSLVELVDHVLNKGVVLAGEATIAIADVDLIYLGLNIVLGAADRLRDSDGLRRLLPWPDPDDL